MEENPGLSAAEAAHRAMGEITGAIVAITLVLLSVFVPVAFIPGISGQLFQQFAVAVSVSMVLSAINALTLSPALCAILLKPHHGPKRGPSAGSRAGSTARATATSASPASSPAARSSASCFSPSPSARRPGSSASCRPASCRPRTRAPSSSRSGCPRAPRSTAPTPPCARSRRRSAASTASPTSSRSPATASSTGSRSRTRASSSSACCPSTSAPTRPAASPRRSPPAMRQGAAIREAQVFAFNLPPIIGLGTGSGFEYQLLDLEGRDPIELAGVAGGLTVAANQDPRLGPTFTTFSAGSPQLYPRPRPRAAADPRRLGQRPLHHAPGHARPDLRQRLQPVRPHLAGEHPGAPRPTAPRSPTSTACTCATPPARWCR